MEDIDPDQERIMGLLEPYLRRIYPIFPAAVDLYNSEVTPLARADHDIRAISSVTWCHVWEGFKREFMDEPGFNFLDFRGLHVLNIRDELVVRGKKVDEEGRHRNAKTAQQKKFDSQQPLPGLPPAASRVVIGYQPDIAFSCVERVTVRRPKGRWVSQIIEHADAFSWVDITPAELPLAEGLGKKRK